MTKLEVLRKDITEVEGLEVNDLTLCRRFTQGEIETIRRFTERCEKYDGISRYVAITRDKLAVLTGPVDNQVSKDKAHHAVMGKLRNVKSRRFFGLFHPSVYFSFVQGVGMFPIDDLTDLLVTPIEDTLTH